MPKASPSIISFNAGEVSKLVEGRIDLDRAKSSCRQMVNAVAAPQGPLISRSGSAFLATTYDKDRKSIIEDFVANDEGDATNIEFTHSRVRFCDEDGLLVFDPVTATVSTTSPFVIDSATLTATAGSQVVLSGFGREYNLNGVQANVTAVAGTLYTLDIPFPALPAPGGLSVALVYHVASPYTEDDIGDINALQSLDVLYLTRAGTRPYKLKRNDTYDWEFVAIEFLDGPYMDKNLTPVYMTPSATGKATPDMTSNAAPSGTCFGGAAAGKEEYKAFDAGDLDTYWQSATADQLGTVGYQTPGGSGFICDGYAIHVALDNSNLTYTNKNYAPADFTLEGSNDGVTWFALDRKREYILYDDNKSLFFEVVNDTSYEYHRVDVKTLGRNGPIPARIRSLVLRSTTSSSLSVTVSSIVPINNGAGFLSTDVDRLMRLRGSDGAWRSVKITSVTSTTVVDVTLLGEPFPDLDTITEWRMGYWSETTGWPNYAQFFQDRLWFGGSDIVEDLLVGSASGDYENMAPSTQGGEVLATDAIVTRPNSRKISRIRWMEESSRGLLIGTGSQEFVLASKEGSGKDVQPGTVKVDPTTRRGSASVKPASVDEQIVYAQRSGRALREYAYAFDVDNFKSPSMSLLSSHLGAKRFAEMAYASEPYSIIWVRREDGSMVGLTYNREENVVGWHQQDFGAEVESISVLPAKDNLQDKLFMVLKRVIDGVTYRYIEVMTRFWDFDLTIEQSHFVDSAVRYEGTAETDMYNLQHLEGEEVYGLADNIPVGPLTVGDGHVQLEHAASSVLLGLGYESLAETSRIEAGSENGTAQGKEKRIHKMAVLLWDSYGGEVGSMNEDTQEVEWVPLEYPEDTSELTDIELFSDVIGNITLAPGYSKNGTVFVRKPKDSPLPFNVISLMPQLHTND